MRTGLGLAMLLIGLLPIAALLGFVWWTHRMYTVGLSMTWEAVAFLSIVGLIDAVLIAIGIRILRTRRTLT